MLVPSPGRLLIVELMNDQLKSPGRLVSPDRLDDVGAANCQEMVAWLLEGKISIEDAIVCYHETFAQTDPRNEAVYGRCALGLESILAERERRARSRAQGESLHADLRARANRAIKIWLEARRLLTLPTATEDQGAHRQDGQDKPPQSTLSPSPPMLERAGPLPPDEDWVQLEMALLPPEACGQDRQPQGEPDDGQRQGAHRQGQDVRPEPSPAKPSPSESEACVQPKPSPIELSPAKPSPPEPSPVPSKSSPPPEPPPPDPVATALVGYLQEHGAIEPMSAANILKCLAPYHREAAPDASSISWPARPESLGHALVRIAPLMRQRGYVVERASGSRRDGRKWQVKPIAGGSSLDLSPSPCSDPSHTLESDMPRYAPTLEDGKYRYRI